MNSKNRYSDSFKIRLAAAELAKSRPHPRHISNAEEFLYRKPHDKTSESHAPSHIASFTKGLEHDKQTGVLLRSQDFNKFVRAVDSPDEITISAVPLGPIVPEGVPRFTSGIAKGADVRAWESMGAGSTYDLEGPDSQSVTMPPAPTLDSPELVVEMTEMYWMALLRDLPFNQFHSSPKIKHAVENLNNTDWVCSRDEFLYTLTEAQRKRLRGPFTPQTIFRGVTRGDQVGPYLSQFLLIGNTGIANGSKIDDGFIQYGATRIDQRVRFVEPYRDFMTNWLSFYDVQNGADVRGREVYSSNPSFRFISTPRDLATYVHFDALYQAYLDACLILLSMNIPYDKGLPFQLDDNIDKQQTFATFGGPHILSLVTEVATRALKAIRFQKYNVHRRLRPEAVAGLVDRYHNDCSIEVLAGVKPLYDALEPSLLDKIAKHNSKQNTTLSDDGIPRTADLNDSNSAETRLLPMAFPEGSPMHPSYGAGHAAVAGACVTILKAFFDHSYELRMADGDGVMQPFAFVATPNGQGLKNVIHELGCEALTVEGELNKVCSNICIGRNWAGVHYFTDYRESIALGEQVAIGILEEQKLTFGENFSMTVPLFDGTVIRI